MKKIIGLLLMGILVSGCRDYEKIIGDAREHKKKVGKQIIDGEEEPPFPNESENNKTLRGVDVNQNGIRDDVEIWINYVGKDRNHRMALRQLAKMDQTRMIAGEEGDQKYRIQVAKDYWDASNCASFFEKGQEFEKRASYKIVKIVYNVSERENAYKKFHSNVIVYESNDENFNLGKAFTACNFKIDNLNGLIEK
ncbi:hypothetical protein DOM21_11300 [Bacteriovorax stolpii]|uniref:hypothetical protein n=1 Tax=Bacteriovorax stolpii TaxID=960 RepID=UPI001157533B|nr:hypothetical protein [Bacteriovorax stolpii]QDK42022.1 hypothetical protein DOM21_11300 [Bacteriovorax stolpii]